MAETQKRVLLVDPADELRELGVALADADTPFVTRTVSSTDDALVDGTGLVCVVVTDTDSVDGREQLAAALDRFDTVPVVAFVIGFDESFVIDAKSMGAADVISVPRREAGDGLFPEATVGRIERLATQERSQPSKATVLDSLLENYPHQLYVKNEHHQHEIVSRSTAEQYDLSREQLRGLTDYELVGKNAPELHAEEQAIMEAGEPVINDIERYEKDGRTRWVSTTKAPRYEDGSVVGIVGSARDVTEQKRREAKLTALHAASRELVAAQTREEICRIAVDISDGVPDLPPAQVLLADNGDLSPAVSSGEDNPNGPCDSWTEHHGALFTESYDRDRPMSVDIEGTRRPLDAEIDDCELDGVSLPLADHGVLALATEGPVDEFTVELARVMAANLKVALDRAVRDEMLTRQNEQLEEFAQIVSHDLRNPLSVAQGYLGLLEGEEELVEEIDWALDRMESLIEELLTLAKNGQVVSETTLLSLPEVAREAWQHVETTGATLVVHEEQAWTSTRASGTNQIYADRDRLLELLENLFRNSVEHGSTNSRSQTDDSVEHGSPDPAPETQQDSEELRVVVGGSSEGFYVEDDGHGISEEETDAVFAQGYTTAEDGTGFGLYIVETLAEAHGWSVSVADAQESETGARFEIRT